jgi:hypothetical protein
MFGFTRRRPTPVAGVRFCDSCARVSTTAERAERRTERARDTYQTLISPR